MKRLLDISCLQCLILLSANKFEKVDKILYVSGVLPGVVILIRSGIKVGLVINYLPEKIDVALSMLNDHMKSSLLDYLLFKSAKYKFSLCPA